MSGVTMEIPPEWLVEAGLQDFTPPRSAIRCAVPHELVAIADIEPFVRQVALDANGFRKSKIMPVLELVRDDRLFADALQVVRQVGQWQFGLHNGVHRFYASRTLGFTHVPAEVVDLNF
jgi:hypothetical protein